MRDFRYAWRSLSRSKGFVVVAVLSLALALGLNTTVYAVLEAFTHPWVPFRDPERLLEITAEGDQLEERISWVERDSLLMPRLRAFSDSIAWAGLMQGRLTTTGSFSGEANIRDVSANYFQVVGIAPDVGQLYEPRPDENVVVVERAFWHRALGDVRDLHDVSVTIEGQTYRVAAVLPPGQPFYFRRTSPEIWRLLPNKAFQTLRWRRSALQAPIGRPIIRVRDGATVEDVRWSLHDLAQSLEKRFGIVRMYPFRFQSPSLQPDPYNLSNFHLALAASALTILLIACANLANLVSARGVSRKPELALRMAIGAGRKALINQMLAEAVILAGAGGVLGLFIALWGVNLVSANLPQVDFLALRPPHISWRLFAFGAFASVTTVLLFGLWPAIRASDVNVAEPMKEGGGTHTGRTQRVSVLAVAQFALALMLVMSATVLTKAVRELENTDFGFEPAGLHQLWVSLDTARFPDQASVEDGWHEVLTAGARVPGIRSTASVYYAKATGNVVISDFDGDTTTLAMVSMYPTVSENFLRTLGIPVIDGRDFAPGDRGTGGAAIVNEAAARILWPGQRAVGRMIKLGYQRSPAPWYKVVGLAQRARCCDIVDPEIPDPPQVYVMPSADRARNRGIVFRAGPGDRAAPALLASTVRTFTGSPPGVPLGPWLRGFQNRVGALRVTNRVFAFIGACGLGLAAVGLYGVLSYAVSRRTREFGVRMALGATTRDISTMVLHDGAVMCLLGSATGGALAMVAGVILQAHYESPPADLASLGIAAAILFVTAVVACAAPARRAVRANPVDILRAT